VLLALGKKLKVLAVPWAKPTALGLSGGVLFPIAAPTIVKKTLG
jgi:hypothetical protein